MSIFTNYLNRSFFKKVERPFSSDKEEILGWKYSKSIYFYEINYTPTTPTTLDTLETLDTLDTLDCSPYEDYEEDILPTFDDFTEDEES